MTTKGVCLDIPNLIATFKKVQNERAALFVVPDGLDEVIVTALERSTFFRESDFSPASKESGEEL